MTSTKKAYIYVLFIFALIGIGILIFPAPSESHDHEAAQVHFAGGNLKIMPPKHWRLRPFKVTPAYYRVHNSKVRSTCRKVSRKYGGNWNPPARIAGCAIHDEAFTYCAIVVSKNDTKWFSASAAERHEEAHCKGWTH